MKILLSIFVSLSILSFGCTPSPQQKAYEKAVTFEQQFYILEQKCIHEYRKVMSMDPTSKWAEKSQKRVDVLEEKHSAKMKELLRHQ